MKKKRVIGSLLAIAVVVILTVSANAQNSSQIDADRESAVALWEEVIRAKGGRERLNAIENVMVVSSVDVEAPRRLGLMEIRKLYVLPDSAWLRGSGSGVSLEAIIVSIERNLCRVTTSPKGANPGLSPCLFSTWWSAHIIHDQTIYLLETPWIRPKPLRTRIEGSGSNRIDVIEAEINGARLEFYLDGKTRLPFKIVTNTSNGAPQSNTHRALTVKLRDYQSVDGIQMPRTIIRESAPRPTMVSLEKESARYTFNVDYDKSIFELPSARRNPQQF